MPTTAARPDFNTAQFRQALSQFATGVTVVTARGPGGELAGLTVSSFNAVSLAPPLVLWSLNRAAQAMALMAGATHYAVHVLGHDQQALAERFAGPREARWLGLTPESGAGGAPLLAGCAAVFECFNRSRHEEGDHVIFVGEVERCRSQGGISPLLYHGGRFHTGTL